MSRWPLKIRRRPGRVASDAADQADDARLGLDPLDLDAGDLAQQCLGDLGDLVDVSLGGLGEATATSRCVTAIRRSSEASTRRASSLRSVG